MIAAAKIDAFGFAEAANTIHSRIVDTANRVGFNISRSAALLRSLHFQLLNTDMRSVNIHDVEALVALALSALPDPDGEAFDIIDCCGRDADQTVKAMLAQQQAMSKMLEALDVAADMCSTREELNEVANGAYAAATVLPDGQRHWDAFCALVTRRGLHIELLDLGLGPSSISPIVHTDESRKLAGKVRRKAHALGKEARAVDEAMQTRKRHRGKA